QEGEAMPVIDRDGVPIHYEVHGPRENDSNMPPILLSHGYGATSRMWDGQVAAFADRYRLVLWDMRGHGQSGDPADPTLYSHALTVGDTEARLGRHRSAQGLAGAARGMLTMTDGALIGFLPQIAVPTLVLVGADDQHFLAAADYMASKIPGAQKAVIPNAGHAANLDQPLV